MNKSELANALVEAAMVEELLERSNANLVKIIETAFSALGTQNPDLAINALDQLVSQREKLVLFKRKRKEDQRMNSKLLKSKLPASFEEGN